MTGRQQQIIVDTRAYVKSLSESDTTGHDYWHIHRVERMAGYLAKKEGVPIFFITMAALLHDVDDWKFNESSSHNALSWLKKQSGIDQAGIAKIMQIIDSVSYKGLGEIVIPETMEGKIVQDADRLDAIGAIGIARAFAYGGAKNRTMFVPNQLPRIHIDFEDYKNNKSHTINHFYEKLLHLKNLMNTEAAKYVAEERHRLMETFLKHFYEEWNFGD